MLFYFLKIKSTGTQITDPFPNLFNFPSLLFLLIALFSQSLTLYVAYIFKSLCPTSQSKEVEAGYVD